MYITCLDMEGVLVPEIWIAFAEASGIPALKRTTRDEPDYHKLMEYRLGILREHGLGLREIQATIAQIDPLPGARAFLDELRSFTQVLILSDTFEQFAQPLMKKLNWPTLFCNTLEVAPDGAITGFRMRCPQSKLTTVKALQSIGYDTIAAGDSYNDLGMIQASRAGFLFKSTAQIKAGGARLRGLLRAAGRHPAGHGLRRADVCATRLTAWPSARRTSSCHRTVITPSGRWWPATSTPPSRSTGRRWRSWWAPPHPPCA